MTKLLIPNPNPNGMFCQSSNTSTSILTRSGSINNIYTEAQSSQHLSKTFLYIFKVSLSKDAQQVLQPDLAFQ